MSEGLRQQLIEMAMLSLSLSLASNWMVREGKCMSTSNEITEQIDRILHKSLVLGVVFLLDFATNSC